MIYSLVARGPDPKPDRLLDQDNLRELLGRIADFSLNRIDE